MRATLLVLLGLSLLGSTGCRKAPEERPEAHTAPGARIVSLSPAVTETLERLRVEERLVGRSDFCEGPDLPRVGTAITPSYEKIAALSPNLIVTTQVAGTQGVPLQNLAPTVDLPWLSVADVAGSVRKLGALVERGDEAENLARRFETELAKAPPPGAPRVLLVIGAGEPTDSGVWFVRDDSLHGAQLRAAGFENAAPRVLGAPRLTPEELLALDPDAILVLREGAPDAVAEQRALVPLAKLTPLSAVRKKRLGVLSLTGALAMGPGLLERIAPLRERLLELFRGSETGGVAAAPAPSAR